jgi:hypothetical protein
MRQLKLVCASIVLMGASSGALAQADPLTLQMVGRSAAAEHARARFPMLSQAESQVIEGAQSAVSRHNAQ